MSAADFDVDVKQRAELAPLAAGALARGDLASLKAATAILDAAADAAIAILKAAETAKAGQGAYEAIVAQLDEPSARTLVRLPPPKRPPAIGTVTARVTSKKPPPKPPREPTGPDRFDDEIPFKLSALTARRAPC